MSLVENSLMSSLPLVVTSVLKEIQSSNDRVYSTRGQMPLNNRGDVDDPSKYEFYSILDAVIYS